MVEVADIDLLILQFVVMNLIVVRFNSECKFCIFYFRNILARNYTCWVYKFKQVSEVVSEYTSSYIL